MQKRYKSVPKTYKFIQKRCAYRTKKVRIGTKKEPFTSKNEVNGSFLLPLYCTVLLCWRFSGGVNGRFFEKTDA